jgi:hypothetical protein
MKHVLNSKHQENQGLNTQREKDANNATESELLAQEARLDEKERILTECPPSKDPVVVQTLAKSLLEERTLLTMKWASLVEDKKAGGLLLTAGEGLLPHPTPMAA